LKGLFKTTEKPAAIKLDQTRPDKKKCPLSLEDDEEKETTDTISKTIIV
jgi:hypothetical protein